MKTLLRKLAGKTPNLPWHHRSWGLNSNDLLLSRMLHPRGLKNAPPGTFADIGAFHPHKHSNSYLFYRWGWRGINVDARPGAMEHFHNLRPEDTNLELAVGPKAETRTFFTFSQGEHNTADPQVAQEVLAQNPEIKLVAEHQLDFRPLAAILEEHLPTDKRFDFLSVDVEGLDLQVLQSNDWARFRPRMSARGTTISTGTARDGRR